MLDEASISNRIGVIVCDPCPLVFTGLQKSFETDSKIQISCDVPNVRALNQRVEKESFDVALIEWSMIAWHDHESLQLLRAIGQRSRVVLMGMTETTREHKHALEYGVRGIVSRRSTARRVRKAICKVAEGGLWIERADAETLLDHVFSPAPDAHQAVQRLRTLTPREAEIITLVCAGLRNKQIAAKLCISETTVWHHMSSIFSKLRVSDRVALVRFAFQYDVCQHIERGLHAVNGPDRRGFRTALPPSEELTPAITSLAS